jgi:peptidoglycan hydrolase-like protein with peptidoglycan-binding domain
MAASAKRRKAEAEPDHFIQRGVAALGGFISRNPAAVGGSTAFLVSLLYVSANAIWYQPHAHTGPLFVTRAFETFVDPKRRAEQLQPQTTINIERGDDAAPPPRLSDPIVEKVQRILGDLGFYAGDVDGIKGPNTSQAVEAYQRKMGLTPSGTIDQELLEQLGADETTGAIVPSPRPRVESSDVRTTPESKALVAKIQTGLRAFGNKDIDVDGVAGARTKAAIKEFQGLFGLPQTGEPERAVYAKMKETKLVE